jgi:hypothetical protein
LTAPFEQCSLCNSAPACCEMYRAKRVEKI